MAKVKQLSIEMLIKTRWQGASVQIDKKMFTYNPIWNLKVLL